MTNIFRQIFSFILPVTVLIIVPLCIEKNIALHGLFPLLAGLLIICAGLFIMIVTISMFIRIGKGTLAPWSPTKKLIIESIYRHVRNPMIIGVLIVLIGESISVLSWNIFIWAIIFFVINNIYFVLLEEPKLEKKFGEEYLEYKKNVPRWIPRTKPYRPYSEKF
jgi:protein-S-isoprenylcysteine O-methyltransferase Ste14